MATYLYCLRSDATGPPEGLQGIDGAIVHAIESVGLTAWVSDVDGSVEAGVERVKAHDAVCAAAMRTGDTPVPVRFGQTFVDDAAAAAAIASRESTLRGRLARVAGCVELRIVVTRGRDADVNESPMAASESETVALATGEGSDVAAGPGTAFLKRLARAGRADLAREVGCEEVRHALRAMATSLIVDQQPCESARGVSFFPVLVRRASVDEVRSAIAGTLSPQSIDLTVLGPFAPYSFAGDA